MIPRAIQINKFLKPQKVLILYGARRVGKTTLLKDFLSKTKLKYRFDSGDNIRIQRIFESQDFNTILEYAEGYDIVAIDEAQYIKNVGMGLKILVDNNPELKVIATGSSPFDLQQQIGEPLTGRKRIFMLYPLSFMELRKIYNRQELKDNLNDFLVYGLYPEIVITKSKKEKVELLRELVDSYLLKDILSIERIKGSRQLYDLLKLLSFQIGSEVSLNELATQIGMDVKTIGKYLDILEKGFVIKKVNAFSKNLRKEITSKSKYYFYDVGIRNAIISQFNPLEDRNDVGALFENFLIMERMKVNSYKQKVVEYYFWRTYDGQEIDFVEEVNGKIYGYEFKFSPTAKFKIPSAWLSVYPNAKVGLINRSNFLKFVLDEI